MAEWLKAPVLKTGDAQASGGSNPSLSVSFSRTSVRSLSLAQESPKNGATSQPSAHVPGGTGVAKEH